MICLKAAGKTDIGRIRAVNEDRAFFTTGLSGYALAIVADGMGGHQAGDVASEMAIDLITKHLGERIQEGMTAVQASELLRESILFANDQVFEYAAQQIQLHGMGTTVVAALATPEVLIVAHIGDSRAYRLDRAGLVKLTEDHSLVNELLKNGQITPEEASNHPRRNVLTRALGTEPDADADVNVFFWEPGDQLLLCTDGLSGLVSERDIARIVSESNSLEKTVDGLIDSALKAGGDDNVTVVLLVNDEIGMNQESGVSEHDR
ncbi:Stp1/IreP family PP2C-type Ser/Thr phosphatase [Paenibacillus sp. y28]|uniref:Stp1/IreP family PP2C-type Ser/Thr phosphatase n=1 Tax=Paenibacillus sp. y28 TaxID=3129110 RepID=UPI00301A5A1C